MPKVAQTTLTDFGAAVHRARALKGWQLQELANAMAGNSSVSFLSDIEKGKRSISPPTVGKLIAALDLHENWIDRFTGADTSEASEVTAEDKLADAALAQSEATGEAQRMRDVGISEENLITLAQRFTSGTEDIGQAWAELKAGIDLAVKVQAEGAVGSNHGDFVDEVLRRATELARDGEYATAGAAIDDALEQADAQIVRLLNKGVDVALLDRDTAKAAALLVRRADVEAGGIADFEELRTLFVHHYEIGRDQGRNLTSALAIDLAQLVLQRAANADERGNARSNYATALGILGVRESGTKRLEQAIAAYAAALEEWTRERVPLDWAMIQMNLGSTLQTLGQRESGTDRLEQAVVAFNAALEELTRERVPLEWAMTQMNLGNAFTTLGERKSSTELLEQAVAAYKAALQERTRERVPLQWAMTQNNLGSALRNLGKRESGTVRLEQAVAAYETALEEWNRERVPLQWAMTQNNLGNALMNIGERESGTERLEQAIAAFRAALEENTRERVPLEWALTQMNLGSALQTLGARESGTERLEQAVAAYEAALEERTRERVPLDWAMTQSNLGTALKTLGERESGTEQLEQAAAAYEAALEEQTRERVPLDWAMTQNNLGTALQTLGQRESGTERLQQAVAAYEAALEERTRERVPLQWAMTQMNLAGLEVAFFEKSLDPQHLDCAEHHALDAREVFVAAEAAHYVSWIDDQHLIVIRELRDAQA